MAAKRIGAVISDMHLSKHTWASHPSLYGDAMWAMECFYNSCAQHDLQWVIFAGDVTDKQMNVSAPIADLAEVVSWFKSKRLKLYYNQGQHEMAEPTWIDAVSDWGIHLHGKTFELSGLGKVYGLDYQKGRSALTEALNNIPADTDVLVAHQVWDEFMGSIAACDGSLRDVPHAHTVITGDLHKHTKVTVDRPGLPELTVLSPGATHMRKIDEPVSHAFFVYTDDQQSPWKSVKLKSRYVAACHVFNVGDIDAVREDVEHILKQADEYAKTVGLPSHIAKPIIRLFYDASLRGTASKFRDIVNDRAFVFEKVQKSETDQVVIATRDDALRASNIGLAGCLDLAVDDRESQLYKDASRLIASDDINLTIKQMFAEHFNETESANT